MPIEKGQDWGSRGTLPTGTRSVADDAGLARLVEAGASHARLRGGDLARTLGVTESSFAREAGTLLPIDVISVSLDDRTAVAAAHVLVGTRCRLRFAVMNAAFEGRRNMAPRAHPGDGRLDVVAFDLSPVDWFKARRRMPSGGHVDHPGVTTRQRSDWTLESPRPLSVTIDGVGQGKATRIRCRVLPEAIVVGV